MKKKKKVKVWVDVGSHGGIFEAIGGRLGADYPHLMQVYSRPMRTDLIPAIITYEVQKGTR